MMLFEWEGEVGTRKIAIKLKYENVRNPKGKNTIFATEIICRQSKPNSGPQS